MSASACRAHRHSRPPRPAGAPRPWAPGLSAVRSRAIRTPACASRSPRARLDIRGRHRPWGAPVPAVELREVARVPGFAEPRGAQVPVRADLAGGGAQVAPQVVERRAAPEPVAVIDAVN